MKTHILVALFALLSASARADSLVTCRDSSGHELFQGFVHSERPLAAEKFRRERDLAFAFAVTVKPVGIDRATFTRITGIDLKACRGPYAKIYEKQEAGHLRCASGVIKEVAIADDDTAILSAMGVEETACSAILTKDKMRGIPGSR